MSTMNVSFRGGVAVDATYAGHTIHTDQPRAAGGADTAMSPFDLFLASIATCTGFYALRFCQERNVATEGLGLTLEPLREGDGKRMTAVRIAVNLPSSFPEKYRAAIERAIDHCAVKNQLLNPPRFELRLSGGEDAARPFTS